MIPAIAIPVGTAIIEALAYVFRFALVKGLMIAGFFGLISIATYFATDYLLPDWFSVETLQSALDNLSPPIAYALNLICFYDGIAILTNALIAAWIIKKLPNWFFAGPMIRAAT